MAATSTVGMVGSVGWGRYICCKGKLEWTGVLRQRNRCEGECWMFSDWETGMRKGQGVWRWAVGKTVCRKPNVNWVKQTLRGLRPGSRLELAGWSGV